MVNIKEKLFSIVGYKFGTQEEIRLNKNKVGTLSMTPHQFLFISSSGKKAYCALPKKLTEATLQYKIKRGFLNTESEMGFSPHIDFVSKDGNALIMNVSFWNGTRNFPPYPNYANLIVKVENEEMSFADLMRYSNNKFGIKSLTKNIIHYEEKVFFGGDPFLTPVIYSNHLKFK